MTDYILLGLPLVTILYLLVDGVCIQRMIREIEKKGKESK